MAGFLKKLNIKNMKSFDTITTKLLLLVVFTTIIPLFVVTNYSIETISAHKAAVQSSNKQSSQKKEDIKDINLIITLFVSGLFMAVGFAIFFSRNLTKPILELVKAANVIAEGDLEYTVNTKGSDEIANLAKAFNLMTQNLKQQRQFRENFIAALTHDLKVPMLAENQTVNYLLKETYGPLTDEQKEVLEIIKSTNNSSLEMVSTLLDVYKYDMGKVQLTKEEFDIVELLNNSVSEINSLAMEKRIQIETNSTQENIIINADKAEIKRVFHNLLSNALNNTSCGGNIICRMIESPGVKTYSPSDKKHAGTTLLEPVDLANKLFVSIEDTGVGLAKADMPFLFKRFSLSKGRKPAGTGIGLYFSLQVIEKHNGCIWCESTEGKGSSFNIVLPIV